MAGLLDIFGTGGTETLGLLGMSPADIQRNRDDAQAQALYGLAARLFQGGNTGQSIAEGLQQGQKLYSSAMQNQLQEQVQGFQMKDLLEKRKREKEAEARQALIDKAVMGAYQPGQAAIPAQMVEEDGRYIGETPAVDARLAGFDLQAIAPALMATPQGRKTLSELVASQKAMAGETTSLAEGAQLVRTNPLTGKVEVVARGSEKEKPIQFQDLGNVVIGIQGGKEVMRLSKGLAPQRPEAAPSLQTVETANGIMSFNPKTGQLSPLTQNGQPVMGKETGKLTEAQGNAVTYGARMVEADKVLTSLETEGLKNTGLIRSGVSGTVGAVPLIGDALARGSDNIFNTLPTILGGLNEDQQKVIQARTNFITAVLRKESGASIAPTEYATAERIYFPAPGDSPAVVLQKQKARETAIKGMTIQAGPGAKFITKNEPTSSGW